MNLKELFLEKQKKELELKEINDSIKKLINNFKNLTEEQSIFLEYTLPELLNNNEDIFSYLEYYNL
jgi:hypothetical protein